MAWSSKSLGSQFQHNIFRALVRCGMLPAARLLLGPVAFWYALRPSIRQRYSAYLKHRFGSISRAKAFYYTARAYKNFADVLLDRMVLGITGSLPIRQNSETLSQLRAVLAEQRGCILVSAHFGSWQAALYGLETLGQPMNIVQWQDAGDIDRHYFSQGDEHRIRIINPREGLPAMVDIHNALKRNEIVCMMADRFASYEREYVEADFLGGKIKVPSAPWLIASITGAPVMHTFSLRQNGIITGLPPLLVRVPGGIRKDKAALEKLVRLYTEKLESLVMQYPCHFFNFYDMWSLANDERRTV